LALKLNEISLKTIFNGKFLSITVRSKRKIPSSTNTRTVTDEDNYEKHNLYIIITGKLNLMKTCVGDGMEIIYQIKITNFSLNAGSIDIFVKQKANDFNGFNTTLFRK
jgi:hypothetical protein